MSNKLTFEEWKRRLQDECYNSDCTTDCAGCEFSVDKLSAWNFAQAQEQKEIENLQKENESLKKKLEKAEEVIRFYGDKENWLFTGMYCNTGKHKITDRMQAINGWHDQHKSIVNSDIENHSDYLMFGGKRARAYFKENDK